MHIKVDADFDKRDFVFFYESKTCGTYRPKAEEVDCAYVTISLTHKISLIFVFNILQCINNGG